MKRIIPLALICVILAVSLAPAAFASEIDIPDNLFDVLSYSYPNGSTGFTVYAQSENTITADFTLPEYGVVQYVDCIFAISLPAPSDLAVQFGGGTNWYNLTVVHITSNLYRVFGEVGHGSRYFTMKFSGTGLRYMTFQTLNVAYSKLQHYDIEAYCIVSSSDFDDTIHYVPTDEINHRMFLAGSDYLNLGYHLFIYTDDWKKYDFIDYTLSIGAQSILSISCTMGNTVVPCDISYLSNDVTTSDEYVVTIRIDVRELNKAKDDYPQIIITGELTPGAINTVSVLNVSACLASANRNFLVYLFRDLTNNLRTWFNTLNKSLNGDTSSGDAFKEDSSGLISGLGDISASMDAVQRPSMDSINADFTGDISDASVLMAGLFSEVTGIPWLATIILASCTLGLISYILYGKE